MKSILRLVIPAILICFAVAFNAKSQVPSGPQAALVKEQLPNGEYIVVISGVEQRTITADHARAIALRDEDLDKCQRIRAVNEKQIETYEQTLALLKRDRDLADKEAALERERALRFSAMYTAEHELRLKSEQVNARGSVAAFFDKPLIQIAWKAAVPAFQMYLSSRR